MQRLPFCFQVRSASIPELEQVGVSGDAPVRTARWFGDPESLATKILALRAKKRANFEAIYKPRTGLTPVRGSTPASAKTLRRTAMIYSARKYVPK